MNKIIVSARDFPDQSASGKGGPPTTIDNIEYLLQQADITSRYDVIKKRAEFSNSDGSQVSEMEIVNLAAVNSLATQNVIPFANEVALRNLSNPVEDWIKSKAWDGDDRLPAFYATVQEEEGYPTYLKEALLHRWLLSAVAAALKRGEFKARGVLTLQGPQGIGKTSWGRALIPNKGLCAKAFKSDHHMDGSSKDSILGAICHWIVEIGELDSSFKKDVARLKGFLTGDYDKIRAPFARSVMEHPRQTVFFATVNEANFLVDTTGNSRWWTIPVRKLDFNHGVDMQQVFAQLAVELGGGAEWWLTPSEGEALEEQNQKHLSVSAIRERILDGYEKADSGGRASFWVTPMELLERLGFKSASNFQCKEAAAVLRELGNKSSRIKGRDRWRIKPRETDDFVRVPGTPAVPGGRVDETDDEIF